MTGTLTIEDMLGPGARVVQEGIIDLTDVRPNLEARCRRCDRLCEFLDSIDPTLKDDGHVTNRVMWHYTVVVRRHGQTFEACTSKFEKLDNGALWQFALDFVKRIKEGADG